MKKILGVLLLAAVAFTGCMKEDDSYKKWLPVQAGVSIYKMAQLQHRLAIQPANGALRLAALLAQAGDETDLSKPTYNSVSVVSLLYGTGSTVTALDNGDYRITYAGNQYGYDYILSKGSLLVHTNGVALTETTPDQPWSVVAEDFQQTASINSGASTFKMNGGTTQIYRNGDAYVISLGSIDQSLTDAQYRSAWSGRFSLIPPQMDMKFSDCYGKNFKFDGAASGQSCVAALDATGTTGVSLSYSIVGGLFQTNGTPFGGTQTCKILDLLDLSYYPSKTVDVVSTLSSDGKSIVLTYNYNGYSVTQ